MPGITFNACIVTHEGFDFDNIVLGCKEESECLCLFGESCLATDESMLPIGVLNTKDGEICKVGLGICTRGLKKPERVCDSWNRCLCFYNAASFPLTEQTVVSEYHCAYFLLSCLPKFGCCAAPAKEVPTKLSLGGYGAPQAEGETMKR